jgi:hypothetical protein
VCASPRSAGGRAAAGPNVDSTPPELDLTSMADRSAAAELAQRWWAAETSRRSSLAQPHVTALAPDGRDPYVLDLDSISMANRAATAALDATR